MLTLPYIPGTFTGTRTRKYRVQAEFGTGQNLGTNSAAEATAHAFLLRWPDAQDNAGWCHQP